MSKNLKGKSKGLIIAIIAIIFFMLIPNTTSKATVLYNDTKFTASNGTSIEAVEAYNKQTVIKKGTKVQFKFHDEAGVSWIFYTINPTKGGTEQRRNVAADGVEDIKIEDGGKTVTMSITLDTLGINEIEVYEWNKNTALSEQERYSDHLRTTYYVVDSNTVIQDGDKPEFVKEFENNSIKSGETLSIDIFDKSEIYYFSYKFVKQSEITEDRLKDPSFYHTNSDAEFEKNIKYFLEPNANNKEITTITLNVPALSNGTYTEPYYLCMFMSDGAGNKRSLYKSITIKQDITPPIIQTNGNTNPYILEKTAVEGTLTQAQINEIFKAYATVTNKAEQDITISIRDDIKTNTPGKYTLNFIVTDKCQNQASYQSIENILHIVDYAALNAKEAEIDNNQDYKTEGNYDPDKIAELNEALNAAKTALENKANGQYITQDEIDTLLNNLTAAEDNVKTAKLPQIITDENGEKVVIEATREEQAIAGDNLKSGDVIKAIFKTDTILKNTSTLQFEINGTVVTTSNSYETKTENGKTIYVYTLVHTLSEEDPEGSISYTIIPVSETNSLTGAKLESQDTGKTLDYTNPDIAFDAGISDVTAKINDTIVEPSITDIIATDNGVALPDSNKKVEIRNSNNEVVTAIDNKKADTYTITYTVEDLAGNKEIITRTITVKDHITGITFTPTVVTGNYNETLVQVIEKTPVTYVVNYASGDAAKVTGTITEDMLSGDYDATSTVAQELTVKYTDTNPKSNTYNQEVAAEQKLTVTLENGITGIEITTQPTNKTYTYGDALSSDVLTNSGMILKYTRISGVTEETVAATDYKLYREVENNGTKTLVEVTTADIICENADFIIKTNDNKYQTTIKLTINKIKLTASDFEITKIDGTAITTDNPIIFNNNAQKVAVKLKGIVASILNGAKEPDIFVTANGVTTVNESKVKYYQEENEVTNPTNVGTYTVKISALSGNYCELDTEVSVGTFEIQAQSIAGANITAELAGIALTGAETSKTVEYDRTPKAAEVKTVTLNNKPLTTSDYDVTYEYTGKNRLNVEYPAANKNIAPTDAGTYTVKVIVTGKVNYTGSVEKTYTLTINPIAVKATMGDLGSIYGEELSEYANESDKYTLDKALIAGDSLDIGYSVKDSNNQEISKMTAQGTYSIIGTLNTESNNYTVTFENGTYTISKRPIKVIINNKTGAYEQNIDLTGYSIQTNKDDTNYGLAEGESISTLNVQLSLTDNGTAVTPSNSLDAKTYTINGTANNDNYNVTFVNETDASKETGTYTINPLVITLDNIDKFVTFELKYKDNLVYTPGETGRGEAVLTIKDKYRDSITASDISYTVKEGALNPNEIPNEVGKYEATVRITGKKNLTSSVEISTDDYTIAKANPTMPQIPNLTPQYFGTKLSDIEKAVLEFNNVTNATAGKFVFDKEVIGDVAQDITADRTIGNAGQHKFILKYIPNDTKNYNEITVETKPELRDTLTVEIQVKQAPQTMTESDVVIKHANGEEITTKQIAITEKTATIGIKEASQSKFVGDITYKSLNTDIADVNLTSGVVTLKATGDVTFEVACAGDTNHEACKTTITLKVVLATISMDDFMVVDGDNKTLVKDLPEITEKTYVKGTNQALPITIDRDKYDETKVPEGKYTIKYYLGTTAYTAPEIVGEYSIKIRFTGTDEYAGWAEELDTGKKLKIKKASYNMTGVSFNNKPAVDYDKDSTQSIEITGTLPEGVQVSYTYKKIKNAKGENLTTPVIYPEGTTSVKDAGTYEVTASFTGDANNYELISNMTATITINPIVYDITEQVASIQDKTVTFSEGTTQKIELANKITGIIDEYKLVTTEDVGEVETAFAGAINAGTYNIKAKFSIDPAWEDKDNYTGVSPEEKTATLTINKAKYELNNAAFDMTGFKNDAQDQIPYVIYKKEATYAPVVTAKPGIEISYIYKNENDDEIQGATNAGTYTAKATFTIDADVTDTGVIPNATNYDGVIVNGQAGNTANVLEQTFKIDKAQRPINGTISVKLDNDEPEVLKDIDKVKKTYTVPYSPDGHKVVFEEVENWEEGNGLITEYYKPGNQTPISTEKVTELGTYVIKLRITEGTNYGNRESYQIGTITIEQADQTKPEFTIANRHFGAEEDDTELSASITDKNLKIELTNNLQEADQIEESKRVTYTSSDEEIVTVDNNGNLTFRKVGTATVTVTYAGTTNYKENSTTITINVANEINGIKVKQIANKVDVTKPYIVNEITENNKTTYKVKVPYGTEITASELTIVGVREDGTEDDKVAITDINVTGYTQNPANLDKQTITITGKTGAGTANEKTFNTTVEVEVEDYIVDIIVTSKGPVNHGELIGVNNVEVKKVMKSEENKTENKGTVITTGYTVTDNTEEVVSEDGTITRTVTVTLDENNAITDTCAIEVNDYAVDIVVTSKGAVNHGDTINENNVEVKKVMKSEDNKTENKGTVITTGYTVTDNTEEVVGLDGTITRTVTVTLTENTSITKECEIEVNNYTTGITVEYNGVTEALEELDIIDDLNIKEKITVTLYYKNNQEETLEAKDFSVICEYPDKTTGTKIKQGTNTIKVMYGDYVDTTITITGKQKTATEIFAESYNGTQITSSSQTISITEGLPVDTSKLVVKLRYDNGTTSKEALTTSQYSLTHDTTGAVNGDIKIQKGANTITITYIDASGNPIKDQNNNNITDTLRVTGIEKTLIGLGDISLAEGVTKIEGQTVTSKDFTVVARYNNGDEEVLEPAEYTATIIDEQGQTKAKLDRGTNTIKISLVGYEESSVTTKTTTITAINRGVVSIISVLPEKSSWKEEDVVNNSDVTVTVRNNDGTEAILADDAFSIEYVTNPTDKCLIAGVDNVLKVICTDVNGEKIESRFTIRAANIASKLLQAKPDITIDTNTIDVVSSKTAVITVRNTPYENGKITYKVAQELQEGYVTIRPSEDGRTANIVPNKSGRITIVVTFEGTENYKSNSSEIVLNVTGGQLTQNDFSLNGSTAGIKYDGNIHTRTVLPNLTVVGTLSITTKYYQGGVADENGYYTGGTLIAGDELTQKGPINSGTYDVVIDVAATQRYNEVKNLKVGTLKILKARYEDDYTIKFPSESFPYGDTRTIRVQYAPNGQDLKPETNGILKMGKDGQDVIVKYYCNGREFTGTSMSGMHQITAKFTGSDNYEPIADMSAILTIEGKIIPPSISYDFKTSAYEDTIQGHNSVEDPLILNATPTIYWTGDRCVITKMKESEVLPGTYIEDKIIKVPVADKSKQLTEDGLYKIMTEKDGFDAPVIKYVYVAKDKIGIYLAEGNGSSLQGYDSYDLIVECKNEMELKAYIHELTVGETVIFGEDEDGNIIRHKEFIRQEDEYGVFYGMTLDSTNIGKGVHRVIARGFEGTAHIK